MSLKSLYDASMARLENIRAQVVHGRNGDHRAMADAVEQLVDFHRDLLTPTIPTAPTLPDGNPAYVVEGEWENPAPSDPVHGSLLHPYDVESAFGLTLADGRRLTFPDEMSAREFAYDNQHIRVAVA